MPSGAARMEHMTSATIKLFLPRGDAKSLRTAEISNWTGKAVAAPRTELEELLAREELDKAGVYILIGSDPLTNAPRAYMQHPVFGVHLIEFQPAGFGHVQVMPEH